MKKIFLLFFVFYYCNLFSQTNFIYVDFNNMVNRNTVVAEVQKTVQTCDGNFIGYISNGDNPEIEDKKNDFKQKLEEAKNIVNSGKVRYFSEIDTMLFLLNSIDTKNEIMIYEFVSSEDLKERNKLFTNRLLMCMNWKNKNGIDSNIKIIYKIFKSKDFDEIEFLKFKNLNNKYIIELID